MSHVPTVRWVVMRTMILKMRKTNLATSTRTRLAKNTAIYLVVFRMLLRWATAVFRYRPWVVQWLV